MRKKSGEGKGRGGGKEARGKRGGQGEKEKRGWGQGGRAGEGSKGRRGETIIYLVSSSEGKFANVISSTWRTIIHQLKAFVKYMFFSDLLWHTTTRFIT